ncbi:AAA family ATPase [Pseudomonas sp. SJZ131]|uniref:AAA family ATPase n=1 Tax=Pseudomonas sp. SJZ131 TaxID=2572895 RepID=UPI0035327B04
MNRDGALFVLDEPDLSLHMEWQKMILPALLKLAPVCQFIVATHSPFLVMNTGSEQIVNMAKLVSEAI